MTPTLLLALGILSSSFFGSWHCAGMCGPIASMMSAKKSLLSYHLGRLISYTLLGVVSGALGQFFLNSDFVVLRWISSVLLAVLLCLSGFALIFPKLDARLKKSPWRLQVFQIGRSGWAVGLLTVFLPCGWLYTYAMAAIATRSPWAGGFTLFLFWLGGLPTLSAVPMMVRKTIQSAGLRQQRIAGVVLLISGLYSIGSFMFLH